MKQFRAGFTRTNFSTQNLRGFTLIELLIVIALLGALAVGLLATIDPFEQLKKGRDTSQRNTTAEFYNANLRLLRNQGQLSLGHRIHIYRKKRRHHGGKRYRPHRRGRTEEPVFGLGRYRQSGENICDVYGVRAHGKLL